MATLNELLKKGSLKLEDPLDKVIIELSRQAPNELAQISGAKDLQAKVTQMQGLMSSVMENKERMDRMMKTMLQQQQNLQAQKGMGERLQKFSEEVKKLQEETKRLKGSNEVLEKDKSLLEKEKASLEIMRVALEKDKGFLEKEKEELEKESKALKDQCASLGKEVERIRDLSSQADKEKYEQLEHKLTESNETVKMLKKMVSSMEEDKKGLEDVLKMNKDQLLIMGNERQVLRKEGDLWKEKSKKMASMLKQTIFMQKEEHKKQVQVLAELKHNNEELNQSLLKSKSRIQAIEEAKQALQEEYSTLSDLKNSLVEDNQKLKINCERMQDLEEELKKSKLKCQTLDGERKKLMTAIKDIKDAFVAENKKSMLLVTSLKQNNDDMISQMEESKKSIELMKIELAKSKEEIERTKEKAEKEAEQLKADHKDKVDELQEKLKIQEESLLDANNKVAELVEVQKVENAKHLEAFNELSTKNSDLTKSLDESNSKLNSSLEKNKQLALTIKEILNRHKDEEVIHKEAMASYAESKQELFNQLNISRKLEERNLNLEKDKQKLIMAIKELRNMHIQEGEKSANLLSALKLNNEETLKQVNEAKHSIELHKKEITKLETLLNQSKESSEREREALIVSHATEKERLEGKLNVQTNALINMKALIKTAVEKQTIESKRQLNAVEDLTKSNRELLLSLNNSKKRLTKSIKMNNHLAATIKEILVRHKEESEIQKEATKNIAHTNHELTHQLSVSNASLKRKTLELESEKASLEKAKKALVGLSEQLKGTKDLIEHLTKDSLQNQTEQAKTLEDLTYQLNRTKKDRQRLADMLKQAIDLYKANSVKQQQTVNSLKSTNSELCNSLEISKTRFSRSMEVNKQLASTIKKIMKKHEDEARLNQEIASAYVEAKNELLKQLSVNKEIGMCNLGLDKEKKQLIFALKQIRQAYLQERNTASELVSALKMNNKDAMKQLEDAKKYIEGLKIEITRLDASLNELRETYEKEKNTMELKHNSEKEQLQSHISKQTQALIKTRALIAKMIERQQSEYSKYLESMNDLSSKNEFLINSMCALKSKLAKSLEMNMNVAQQIKELMSIKEKSDVEVKSLHAGHLNQVGFLQDKLQIQNRALLSLKSIIKNTIEKQKVEVKMQLEAVRELTSANRGLCESLFEAKNKLKCSMNKNKQLAFTIKEIIGHHNAEAEIHKQTVEEYMVAKQELFKHISLVKELGERKSILEREKSKLIDAFREVKASYFRETNETHQFIDILKEENLKVMRQVEESNRCIEIHKAEINRQDFTLKEILKRHQEELDIRNKYTSEFQAVAERAQRRNNKQRTCIAHIIRSFMTFQNHVRQLVQDQRESFQAYHYSSSNQISELLQKNVLISNALEDERELVNRQETYFRAKLNEQDNAFQKRFQMAAGKMKRYSIMCTKMLQLLNAKFLDLQALVNPITTMTLSMMHRHQRLKSQLDIALVQLEQSKTDLGVTKELIAYKYGYATWRENEELKRECHKLKEILVEKEVELINLLQLCRIRLEEDKKLILPKHLVFKERELMQKLLEKNKADLLELQP